MRRAKILGRFIKLTDYDYERLFERFDKRHWDHVKETANVPCPLCDKYVRNGCVRCPFFVFADGRAKGCYVALKSVYPTFVQYIQLFPDKMTVKMDDVLLYARMRELAVGACGRLQNRMKKLFTEVQ